ncbi:hypothetical protein [Teredinibacter franksiae]|uniref:hypothetical protein n=1 Tax=Teredinibacter franksiae TaxID=2761453 RepID=UPI001625F1F8|nr:hypothetical protein [Teredinibacter franksiae]
MKLFRLLILIIVTLLNTTTLSSNTQQLAHNYHQVGIASESYRLELYTQTDRIPFNKMHSWKVIVHDTSPSPNLRVDVSIDGGMIAHKHGLPTTPIVERLTTPDTYLIHGLKFQMEGEWFIDFILSDTTNNTLAIRHIFNVECDSTANKNQ